MITVKEAMDQVLAGVGKLPPEQVSIADALGRVLAEPVKSRITQPPFPASSMDGYAVRAEDVQNCPVTLPQIGESAAGRPFEGTVGAGQCTRIFTGAVLPDGADAVIMQENTEANGDQITFLEGVGPGNFIRPRGLDFKEGDALIQPGHALTSRDLGLAAAMNVPWVMVARKPKVAILATGDEVVMPGDALKPGQIVSSNTFLLKGMVEALGGEAYNLGTAADTEESLQAMLAGIEKADVLLTIGGASVGDHDLVGKVLAEKGMETKFWKVAMRPGKPLICGTIGTTRVLGLPGNPVSAGVTAIVFLEPLLRTMLGCDKIFRDTLTATLGRDVKENDSRREYMRAKLEVGSNGDLVATPFDLQDSAMMARFAEADCLVVREIEAPAANKGDKVEIVPLRDGMISI